MDISVTGRLKSLMGAVAILSALVFALITLFLWKLVSMDFWHN